MLDFILQHAKAEAEAGDWDAVAAILSADVKTRNERPWKWGDLRVLLLSKFDETVVQKVGKTLMNAAMSDPDASAAWTALSTVGLTISDDDRQDKIDLFALAGQWPNAVRDAIKSAGVTVAPLAGRVVTAEECKIEYDKHMMNQQFSALFSATIAPAISTGDRAAVVVAIQAVATEME